MMAGNSYVSSKYPFVYKNEGSKEEWYAFANDDFPGDNYALRVLAGDGCCNGTDTDPKHLETAKELLSRFTYIVDIACLMDGLEAIADQLHIDLPPQKNKKDHSHSPVSERVPYPDVYEHMRDRNKLGIELHEWAKERAIVSCDEIAKQHAAAEASSACPP
jgi:hypothetical protein